MTKCESGLVPEVQVGSVPNLTELEWTETMERLALHASNKLVRLTWRGLRLARGGSIPGGLEPADVAQDAIVDVIEGRRAYDPVKYPSFLAFLKGVVDSKISALVNGLENRRSRRPDEKTNEDGDPPAFEPQDDAPWPDVQLVDDEAHADLRSRVQAAIADDPVATQVFGCFEAEITKPGEIAEVLGIKIEEVYNAQKRLRRPINDTLNVKKARNRP